VGTEGFEPSLEGGLSASPLANWATSPRERVLAMSEYNPPDQTPLSPPPPPPPEASPGDEAPDALAPEPLPPEPLPPSWVALTTMVGLGLAVVVTAQVLAAIAEGMALKRTEPQGLPGDTFHRIGYAFSSLGASSLLFLVVAVVLVSLPIFLRARTTARQETLASAALGLTVVMSVVIAVGSILTVRYNLHLYSASHRGVPSFVRLQLVFFLVGALGTAVLAVYGALAGLGLRDREPEPAAAGAS
jgi:hypothetical protein